MKFKILKRPDEKVLHRFTSDGTEEANEYLLNWVKENMGKFETPSTFWIVSDEKVFRTG